MPTNRPMQVIGMMSGTSADGMDVALTRISGKPPQLSAKFVAHHHVGFSTSIRKSILDLANGADTSTAEISHLNFVLGEEFARAAIAACRKWRVPLSKVDLIGSHGQTIFHRGESQRVRGARRIASTLQIGEPSIIAQRTGVDTIARLSPRRYRRQRPRRAPRSVRRLPALSRRQAQAASR